jgi:hypothetical protein
LDFLAFCGREKLTDLPARRNTDSYENEYEEYPSDLRFVNHASSIRYTRFAVPLNKAVFSFFEAPLTMRLKAFQSTG